MRDIELDWETSKKRNRLWLNYLRNLICKLDSNQIAPPAVRDIFSAEMNKLFTLPDSLVSAELPKVKTAALYNTLLTEGPISIISLFFVSVLTSGVLDIFSNKYDFFYIFIIVYSVYLTIYVLRLHYRISIVQILHKLNMDRYSICWDNPERLGQILDNSHSANKR